MATAEYDVLVELQFSTDYVHLPDIVEEFNCCAQEKGLHYLTKVSAVVDVHQGQKVRLRNPRHPVLKIGGLDHTIYKGEKAIVEEWGNFYLPDKVNMKVVGAVEGFPCQSGQLVLMTCEDKRLFTYDGEELHLVASNLGDVFKKGFKYPGIKTFYRGESFKAMSQSDWAEVRKGSVGKRLDQAHLDLVRKEKISFMECLEVIWNTRKMAEGGLLPVVAMATAPDRQRREKFLATEDSFRTSAFNIIMEVLELNRQTAGDTTVLVDEILHSIFFMGIIHNPPYPPDLIVSDVEMFNRLNQLFPRPFDCYSSEVPMRSPFSCVLDLVVKLPGVNNDIEIKTKLQELIKQLKSSGTKHLVSSTLCVSQNSMKPNSVQYYGVSMSTSGRIPGKIMVAASCLRTWDSCVADAVMSCIDLSHKSDFNGTIDVAQYVRCQAFKLSTGEILPPCCSCGVLFGLHTHETKWWPYGNCAEAESLSNLLKNEERVKEQVLPRSVNYTEEKKNTVTEYLQKHLNRLLRQVNFEWNGSFYPTPE